MNKLKSWLASGKYLPEFMRDFHDQKDLFKTIHSLYSVERPDWVDAQIYVIDKFLWYMASRGYTLQKSRKQIDFLEFKSWRDINRERKE